MPETHIGPINRLLEKAAGELGLNMQPMPKGIIDSGMEISLKNGINTSSIEAVCAAVGCKVAM